MEIADQAAHGDLLRGVDQAREARAQDLAHNAAQRCSGQVALGLMALKQAGQRNAFGVKSVSLLRPGHGPLPDPDEARCTRVAGGVIRRYRGAGQDEPSGLGGEVDVAARQIPQVGHELPLVEKTRAFSRQQHARVDVGRREGLRGVEQHV